METNLNRNGFITFWLWLGIIINLITIPISIFNLESAKANTVNSLCILGMPHDVISSIGNKFIYIYIVMILQGIFMIKGYAGLLKWRKSGFWYIVGTQVVGTIGVVLLYNSINDPFQIFTSKQMIQIAISAIISIIVLWAILQIKKDKVSCWKQLY